MDLFPTATTRVIESVTRITDTVPVASNAIIFADSTCTASRAAINFYCSANPIAKVCFGASCLFRIAGSASSGIALATSFMGVPATAL